MKAKLFIFIKILIVVKFWVIVDIFLLFYYKCFKSIIKLGFKN